MNIFPLVHADKPDRHIVKMPLESAQQLCYAAHLRLSLRQSEILALPLSDSDSRREAWNTIQAAHTFDVPWAPSRTHTFHPCTIWTAMHVVNWNWHVQHLRELLHEYHSRYPSGNGHANVHAVLEWASKPSTRLKLYGERLTSCRIRCLPEAYVDWTRPIIESNWTRLLSRVEADAPLSVRCVIARYHAYYNCKAAEWKFKGRPMKVRKSEVDLWSTTWFDSETYVAAGRYLLRA